MESLILCQVHDYQHKGYDAAHMTYPPTSSAITPTNAAILPTSAAVPGTGAAVPPTSAVIKQHGGSGAWRFPSVSTNTAALSGMIGLENATTYSYFKNATDALGAPRPTLPSPFPPTTHPLSTPKPAGPYHGCWNMRFCLRYHMTSRLY